MAATEFTRKGLLDHVLGTETFDSPSDIYVALKKDGNEIEDFNYSRVLHNDWTPASSADPSEATNDGEINFPTPSADWGEVNEFSLFDAETGGNELFTEKLDIAKTINENDIVSFADGKLKIRFGSLSAF